MIIGDLIIFKVFVAFLDVMFWCATLISFCIELVPIVATIILLANTFIMQRCFVCMIIMIITTIATMNFPNCSHKLGWPSHNKIPPLLNLEFVFFLMYGF